MLSYPARHCSSQSCGLARNAFVSSEFCCHINCCSFHTGAMLSYWAPEALFRQWNVLFIHWYIEDWETAEFKIIISIVRILEEKKKNAFSAFFQYVEIRCGQARAGSSVDHFRFCISVACGLSGGTGAALSLPDVQQWGVVRDPARSISVKYEK